ncbi:N-acetyltransferase family protein [Bradyrhizobium sp. BR 1432]|uniref:GNAT family N-acetyltransferase n=1 Tax=Bradyrhizobium sp. BR 1432 TaxID=3447966 RepID=UPI003EE792B7
MTLHSAIAQAEVEIRRLTVDDLEIFREIRAEALQKHPQTFGSPEEDEGGDAMLTAYRRWLGSMVLGAFGCGSLIGIAGFYVSADKRTRHRGHIYTVYVTENSRGRGVGDRLIRELLTHAEACVEQVHLDVLTTATAAIRTYRRNGFEVYGTDPRAVRFGNAMYDKHLMVRRFSQ